MFKKKTRKIYLFCAGAVWTLSQKGRFAAGVSLRNLPELKLAKSNAPTHAHTRQVWPASSAQCARAHSPLRYLLHFRLSKMQRNFAVFTARSQRPAASDKQAAGGGREHSTPHVATTSRLIVRFFFIKCFADTKCRAADQTRSKHLRAHLSQHRSERPP